MFAAELTALAAEHPGYRFRLRTTREHGRLDFAELDGLIPDWRTRQTWACGPEGMLTAAERAWDAAGIPERLHLERFAVSRAAAQGSGGVVTFERSNKTIEADAATPLMEAGESVGVPMPFGCRMGICQSCAVLLVDGHVRDLRTGTEYGPGSRVQTCVSSASGDCTLDL